ncbi:MAG TPA: hypothetical protein VNR64_04015 [Vicinamibacterales bacterium]|nr:hypothetical protein [Vicinamibacterales bacterium]
MRHVPVAVALLALATPAFAQKVTTVPDLTGQQVLVQLSNAATTRAVGEAIALTTAMEIATEPFGTSSGGFIFKLDPSTGLLARTTTTFGPSFTERALTSGDGQVSVGATFSSSSFNKISDFSLSSLPLATISASNPLVARTATANLKLTARTVAISSTIGVTDNVDIGVVVPLVTVKIDGSSSLFNGNGVDTRLAQTTSIFSGIGDVSALAKYRFYKFKGQDMPDPGGVALLVNMRLPTGSRQNLRGLGVTRTLIGGVYSSGTTRVRPHASAGFEFWSKSVDITGNPGQTISIRNQFQYSGGVEIEAAPKLTLLVDLLGQQIFGGGKIGLVTDTTPSVFGATSTQSLVALPDGVTKLLLAPGMKVNLKGKMLLSVNALVTMKNNGLHATVTPVAGINLTM